VSACPNDDERLPPWLRPLAVAVANEPAELEPAWQRPPADGSGRPAAVLIALSDSDSDSDSDSGPGVVLIERASGMRTHAGQVAFPGGAADPEDTDMIATALREATEEVGLDAASIQIIGQLPPRFLPPSGFVVTPVLGWWLYPHPVAAVDHGEVASVVIVSLAELAEPANRHTVGHPSGLFGPAFQAGGLFIWGFTAGLLDQLLRLGGWERPWNKDDVRPLPSGAVPSSSSGDLR
jgi:8-oxo-dGTP pyrophosphatase MutT (NUDIX family)